MSGNRLSEATSPYLRQHAGNPVDWWPWGEEALAAARAANKPLLVSIGYAACHWCHVMAHESFEDPATAAVMNELFVNIKVDREERPDVDAVMMQALHILGEPGGWPLTIFATPDGRPFWGGTYFPPQARWGKPGFQDVLRTVAATWREKAQDVEHNVGVIAARLAGRAAAVRQPWDRDVLDRLAGQLLAAMDPVNGGITGAPKFPSAPLMDFLWRAGERTGEGRFTEMFLLTLDRMCQGGIYDHVGGGFARYATDEHWLVPHFEKMLYDNALLLELLAVAERTQPRALWRARARETVAWLEGEMLLPEGAFASSLDADQDGREGAFYVWRKAEIAEVLGPDADFFCAQYDISEGGNWEGVSIPNRLRSGEPAADLLPRITACLARLRDARAARPAPGRDDKILADWNGLAVAALARAATVFEAPAWMDLARAAYDVVRTRMERGGVLGHSHKGGALVHPGFASDHAAMARAAVVLAEETGETSFLADAARWLDVLDRDYRAGSLFMTVASAPGLVVRPRAETDEAVPSAAALAADASLRLAALTGEEAHRARAESIIWAVLDHMGNNAYAGLSTLAMLDLLLGGLEVALEASADEDLRAAVQRLPFPSRLLKGKAPEGLPSGHALLCIGQRCSLPVATGEALRESAVRLRHGESFT